MLRDRKDTIMLGPAQEPLRKYDIALYRVGEQYVLHRVIGVKEDHYVIRGDNRYDNEIVKKDEVLAVAKEYYRGDKKIPLNSIGYGLYVRIWTTFFPVRRGIRWVKGKLWKKKQ